MFHEHAGRRDHDYAIPAAKYFGLSPTYNQWCKLSVADTVYRLREAKGFEGQMVLFYLNHPVQYVYLVGCITSIEAISTGPIMITLDDGSGTCIDLVVRRDKSGEDSGATQTEKLIMGTLPAPQGVIIDPTTLYLDITPKGEGLQSASIQPRMQRITPGLVVKAKGTLSSFRGVRQVDLKRLTVVQDTAEEIIAWTAQANFRKEVLCRPWVLSKEDQALVDIQTRQQAAQVKLEEARRALKKSQLAKRREAHERKKVKREREEEQRRQMAEKNMNEGALL